MRSYSDSELDHLAAWLGDPGNTEPCATFPLDPCRAMEPGIYAWHGDDEAADLFGRIVGCHVHPMYVDQAGGNSMRTGRASGATLKSAIGRTHLRGSTQASSFRRSLAAVLWKELKLRCERPKRLDVASNARLSDWMLEHLSVATAPLDDRVSLGYIARQAALRLDPHFNLTGHVSCPARRQITRLRKRYFSLATTDDERIRRIADMERLAALDPEGSDFLQRRIAQEFEKLHREWAS